MLEARLDGCLQWARLSSRHTGYNRSVDFFRECLPPTNPVSTTVANTVHRGLLCLSCQLGKRLSRSGTDLQPTYTRLC